MIKRIQMSAFMIALVIFSNNLHAAKSDLTPDASVSPSVDDGKAIGQDKSRIIEQLMAASGMNEMIEQLPAMAAMSFDQQPPPPTNQKEYKKFRETYLRVFDPVTIRQSIIHYLSDRYEPQRFNDMLAIANSPLGRKMTALEVQASTPEAQQEMMQMGNVIMGQVSPGRLALAQRLDETQKGAEGIVEIQIMMAKAMMEGVNQIMPPEQRMPEDQMANMLEQMRQQSIYPARQYAQLAMVYTYRTVSDQELEEYLKSYESDTGRWFTELSRDAWLNVFNSISKDLASRMTQSFLKNNAL